MASRLQGKWILITGASSGIGAAAAREFGALGCNLLLGARRLDRLEQVASDAARAGAARALTHPLDVARSESITTYVDWVRAQTPVVDVLVNNAGGAHGLDPLAEGRDIDWETMLETNVLGLLRVTRDVLPLMPRDAGASVINIGSIAGRQAYEGGSAYCGAKAAELQITRALRLELNGTGIRVGTIDPGLTETEFSTVRFKGDTERARKAYEGTHPLTAGDIAESIVWVAGRPPHVNIDEMVIMPVDQAAVYKTYRRTTKGPNL